MLPLLEGSREAFEQMVPRAGAGGREKPGSNETSLAILTLSKAFFDYAQNDKRIGFRASLEKGGHLIT